MSSTIFTSEQQGNELSARHILALLVAHLKTESTITSPSSNPNHDDYHAFLGRGESVEHVVCQLAKIDSLTLSSVLKDYEPIDSVIVDKQYLSALLAMSPNKRLNEAVTRETGCVADLQVSKDFARLPTPKTPLTFIARDRDEDEFIAKTPFGEYGVWLLGNDKGWRAQVTMNGRQENIGARRGLNQAEATALCQTDMHDRLVTLLAAQTVG
jgi:hypothetical protein